MDYTQNTKANLPHVNQVYSSVWDNHPIVGQIGGWVCDKDTGALKYKLHKTDWTKKIDGTPSVLTGEDGDVMVKVPAYYIRITMEPYGQPKFELDDTIPDRHATNGKPGFYVHPAFLTKSGKVKPYILVGAYKGYILNNQLRSISGVKPSASQTISSFTDKSRQGRNTGANKHDITRFYERLALNLLFYFEFGTLDGQTAVGQGWSSGNTESNITGTTNSLGDRSGYVGDTNGKASVRWRGIEDYWGNVWEFVNGFMISDIGYHYTNDVTKFLNMGAMETYAKDLSVKVPNGYITDMEKIPGKEWMMIPKSTGGTSSTYWCDQFWSHDPTEQNIALAGGAWSVGADCGPACWGCGDVASDAYSSVGARLSCSEEDAA
ncbi:hypothetical protein ACQ9ZF_05165 [Cetobacterium somerae]|uniref:hypothetical protein n=1 Tax=Cetobacterium somerae TaxID=188913 RepID=UPI003D766ACB